MVRVHFGPPLLKRQIEGPVLKDGAVGCKNKMARKAALDNMPVACCNRRGFPAGKRVPGPPLLQNGYGGLAQLGERLPCKQEVSGSIPLISTNQKNRKRLTEVPWKQETSLNFLKEILVHLENWTLLLWCNYEKATIRENFCDAFSKKCQMGKNTIFS